MQISRLSPVTNTVNTIELDISDEQWAEYCDPNRTRLIQDIMPNLSDDEREFIMSGMIPMDWSELIAGLEDEDEN